MSIDSQIESLIPEAQMGAHKWLHIVNDDLGIHAIIAETLRDIARSKEVHASGVGLAYGFHNLGRAVDWRCYDASGVYIVDGAHPYYRKCGLIWKALGWNWGGNWNAKPDYDHAQWSDGIDSFARWASMHPEAIIQ